MRLISDNYLFNNIKEWMGSPLEQFEASGLGNNNDPVRFVDWVNWGIYSSEYYDASSLLSSDILNVKYGQVFLFLAIIHGLMFLIRNNNAYWTFIFVTVFFLDIYLFCFSDFLVVERVQSFPQDWELLNFVSQTYDLHLCNIDAKFFYNREEALEIGIKLADYWHDTYHGKPELYKLHVNQYHQALVEWSNSGSFFWGPDKDAKPYIFPGMNPDMEYQFLTAWRDYYAGAMSSDYTEDTTNATLILFKELPAYLNWESKLSYHIENYESWDALLDTIWHNAHHIPDTKHQLAYQPDSEYCKEYYENFFAKYAPNSELRGKICGDLNDFFTMCFFLSNPEWAPKTLLEFVIDPHVYDFVIVMVILMIVLYAITESTNSSTGFATVIPNLYQVVGEMLYKASLDLFSSTLGKQLKNQEFFVLVNTIFLFVLVSNVQGMVPYMITITSYLTNTFFVALAIFIAIIITILDKKGITYLLSLFMPEGCPIALIFLLIPIEIISYTFRVVSLSVRLFANMMAGHTLLKVIVGFSWTMIFIGDLFIIANLFPVIILCILTVLEFGVAFIQAYIFTILTCLYIRDIFVGH